MTHYGPSPVTTLGLANDLNKITLWLKRNEVMISKEFNADGRNRTRHTTPPRGICIAPTRSATQSTLSRCITSRSVGRLPA
jgi:hypothetical protein